MKLSSHAHLYVTAISDQGRQRQNNEDRYAVSAHVAGTGNNIPSLLALVCDGIGGHKAGEVAAEMAVEMISSIVTQSDGMQPLQILTKAISLTSDAIYAESQKDVERQGMGATCVCAWVLGEHLFCASLGDSRLYLLRNGNIQQLTKDHTWIQEAMDAGILAPENARSHPNVHVIRRYLGAPEHIVPDLRLHLRPDESDEQAMANQGLKLLVGDILVMCSDGLTDLVQPAEILENVSKLGREGGARALVELANQRGGHDNTTLVLLEMPPAVVSQQLAAPMRKPLSQLRIPPKILIGCVIVGILLALIAAVATGGVFWFLNQETQKLSTPTLTPAASEAALPTRPYFATSTAAFGLPTVTLPVATITPWPTNIP
jgi:protein phosphatase